MSSGLSLRSAGSRSSARPKARDLIGPTLGLSSDGRPGEHRLNYVQISALEQLFNTHPAIQAARTILHGQLLSGGIALKRDGEEVELKPAFKHHLDEIWVPFAQTVIDSFLKFGYCVVSYEEDDQSLAQQSIKRRKLPGQDGAIGSKSKEKKEPINLIPIVPPTDTYEVAYVMGGRAGYKRNYLVYAMAPNQATKIDFEARVTVRQDPDPTGNINSPMATIFDLGSFVSALTELAMTAEITNARPRRSELRKEILRRGAHMGQTVYILTHHRTYEPTNTTKHMRCGAMQDTSANFTVRLVCFDLQVHGEADLIILRTGC